MNFEDKISEIMAGRKRIAMQVHVKRGWHYTPGLFGAVRHSSEKVLGEHPGVEPDMSEFNTLRAASRCGLLIEHCDELPHLWYSKGTPQDGYDVTIYQFTWTDVGRLQQCDTKG